MKHEQQRTERLLVRPREAFAMLGVGRTLGFELMASGQLETVKLGRRATGIKIESIRRLAERGVRR